MDNSLTRIVIRLIEIGLLRQEYTGGWSGSVRLILLDFCLIIQKRKKRNRIVFVFQYLENQANFPEESLYFFIVPFTKINQSSP